MADNKTCLGLTVSFFSNDNVDGEYYRVFQAQFDPAPSPQFPASVAAKAGLQKAPVVGRQWAAELHRNMVMVGFSGRRNRVV